VDDVADTCRMYAGYFRFVGAIVVTASDGVEALQAVRDHHPDAVLLDLAMPRMTGLELLETLRRDPRHRDLPLVALTGQVGEGQQELALGAGADLYLTKPCLPHVAFNFIVQLLRGQSGPGRTPQKPV
jgi:CheY-like chemotaxis protein